MFYLFFALKGNESYMSLVENKTVLKFSSSGLFTSESGACTEVPSSETKWY